MVLPKYWLQRPAMNLDDQVRAAFDHLLTQVKSAGTNALIPYTLTPPKWQFLCYLAEHHAIALHGTGDPNIRVFGPRQAVDLNAFGRQTAVYAAGDGLWAMFFAVADRERYSMSVNNACIRLADATGQVSEPYYVFSISQTALRQRPWRTGVVYLLPSNTFMAQPARAAARHRGITGRWSPAAVTWGLHILIDIPTHSRRHWAPQFLWPLSPITVDGLSWVEVVVPVISQLFKQPRGEHQ